MTDTIQTAVKAAATQPAALTNVWMYVALAELLCIMALVLKLYTSRRGRRSTERERLKEQVMGEGTIDFANVMHSSFKAKALYDELKGKCHPDKFAKDAALNAAATEIFGRLVKNKYNYKGLCELKERAKKELHVHINNEEE